MAFDFNGSKRPSDPSNDSSRKNIDYSSVDSASDFSGRSVGGFGSFSDRPSSFVRQTSGSDNSFGNAPQRQSGFQNKPSGFSNRPENKSGSYTHTAIRPVPNAPTRSAPRVPAKRHVTQRGASGSDLASIPWRIVLLVIGMVLLVIFCVVFREAITEFLTQVLTWIITILIIVFLVKWFLFGGKRRK